MGQNGPDRDLYADRGLEPHPLLAANRGLDLPLRVLNFVEYARTQGRHVVSDWAAPPWRLLQFRPVDSRHVLPRAGVGRQPSPTYVYDDRHWISIHQV